MKKIICNKNIYKISTKKLEKYGILEIEDSIYDLKNLLLTLDSLYIVTFLYTSTKSKDYKDMVENYIDKTEESYSIFKHFLEELEKVIKNVRKNIPTSELKKEI